MTKNQIIKKYQSLLKDIENDDYYKVDLTNRVNCYTCPSGHVTKTKDVDPGVTPFMHRCIHCGEIAKSTFYNDIAPNLEPIQEWYRPSLEETLALRSEAPGLLDHVLNGGLLYRTI